MELRKHNNTMLNVRTAFVLALCISILMNILFIIMFLYGRPPMPVNEHFRRDFDLNHILVRTFIHFIQAFLLLLINFRLIRSKWFAEKAGKVYFVLILLIITPIMSFLSSVFLDLTENMPRNFSAPIFRGLIGDFTMSAVVSLSSLLMHISEKQQKMALENEKLLAENMTARFMALKNQVDPHFLFNSLNTLSSLIKIDPPKADEYVQQLSFVFRYTLQNKDIISLEEELQFTMAYARLMQLRYGDNLKFNCKIDEKYFPCMIISKGLQTLVENAIKHNVVSNRQPLEISITTSDSASIKVSNPIQPKKEAEGGENIGLSNLAERYRMLWNREISISKENGVFEVEIPLIYESNNN